MGLLALKHRYTTMEAQQMSLSHKSIQALNDKNKTKKYF